MLLLSVVILSIPYIGFEFLRELERNLRDALETSLVDAARATAGPLHEQASLFVKQHDNPGESLYVHELSHPLQVDGYSRDWENYIAWSNLYRLESSEDPAESINYKLIIGHYKQTLYVLLQIKDDDIIYRQASQRFQLTMIM